MITYIIILYFTSRVGKKNTYARTRMHSLRITDSQYVILQFAQYAKPNICEALYIPRLRHTHIGPVHTDRSKEVKLQRHTHHVYADRGRWIRRIYRVVLRRWPNFDAQSRGIDGSVFLTYQMQHRTLPTHARMCYNTTDMVFARQNFGGDSKIFRPTALFRRLSCFASITAVRRRVSTNALCSNWVILFEP